MKIEEQRAALLEAGYTGLEESTDEQVEAAYIEYQTTLASAEDERPEEETVSVEATVSDAAGECPIKGSIQLGDKDPEVMAWWKENNPEEYERRYAGRLPSS